MDNQDKCYPKIQYSVFPKGDKGEQYVIRGETIEEVLLLKNTLLSKLGTGASTPNTQPLTPAAGLSNMDICLIHNLPYNKSGVKQNGTTWHGHNTEIPGKLCFKQ